MNYKVEENQLVINLVGHVSSNNAQVIEEEIFNIINNNPHEFIVIDATGLEYISSAGLRIILKIRKLTENFKIINVCLDVYDVFEMTGFTDMMKIEKAYRVFSVEGLDIIGKGAKGSVYRYNDDTIIKVYNDSNALEAIQNERESAKKAFVLGLPTAISYDIVKVGDKLGSVFELLDSKSLSTLIASDCDNYKEYAKIFARILKEIHANVINDESFPNVKRITDKWINETKEYFDDNTYNKLKALYDNIQDKNNLLHMDFHTNNILMQKDEPLIIDMDTLSIGNPIFEFVNIYVAYVGFGYISDEIVEKFMGFSYEIAQKFYEEVIKDYFGVADITDINNKLTLLGLLRVIRNIKKRFSSYEHDNVILNKCVNKIKELLTIVNDLNL